MKVKERALQAFWAIMTVAVLTIPTVAVQGQENGNDQEYRIVILDQQERAKAERLQGLLQSWGYSPINLQARADGYSVQYGAFESQERANRIMQQLRSEGFQPQGVVAVSVREDAATARERYYSVVIPSIERSKAYDMVDRLRQSNYSPVEVINKGRVYEVWVGQMRLDRASEVLANLRQEYESARLAERTARADQPALPEQAEAPAPRPEPTPAPQAPEQPRREIISPLIMQSDLWKSLSEEQKSQVIKNAAIQEELRSGNALAQEVININKRLENLDQTVKTALEEIKKERESEEEIRQRLNELISEAENLAKAGKYNEAITRLRKVIEIDSENEYNQRNFAERRIEIFQSRMKGEAFPNQEAYIQQRFETLKAEAQELGKGNTVLEMQQALQAWRDAKRLNPSKFGPICDPQIARLRDRIEQQRAEQASQRKAETNELLTLIIGLAIGIVILFLVVVLVWVLSRRRHAELMRKVQEITSIRPMREIGTAQAQGMIEGEGEPQPREGGGGEGDENDIFTPRQTEAGEGSEESVEQEPAAVGAHPKEEPNTEQQTGEDQSDVFGLGQDESSEAPSVGAEPEAFGFDDIFGEETQEASGETAAEEAPEKQQEPPEEAKTEDAFDEAFSSMFSETEEPGQTEGAQAELPTYEEEQKPEEEKTEEPSEDEDTQAPISFDDLLAAGGQTGADETQEGTEANDQEEDTARPEDDEQPPSADQTQVDSRLQDSPFANLFSDEESGGDQQEEEPPAQDPGETQTEMVEVSSEQTDIPSIKLDEQDASEDPAPENTGGLDLERSEPEQEPDADETDLPSFSLEDEPRAATAERTEPAGGGGCELDFESGNVGQQPENWQGDYPYASLVVDNQTPPKGESEQYLKFEKKQGEGKALYSRTFPAISGKVGIEFDLRCDEKNKFLLGFYVEEDGDFQKSIHTKILRSEAQTTPTIHMQGESAPYMLGSWAHIKYLVDLDQGVLNGYIDSTHVVRDFKLDQVPERLNTLAIRDNINTTGVLLLDNIRIYGAS